MTSRRDRQLQQLGIVQWTLDHPTSLRGEIAIPIPIHIRLVMVTNELLELNETLIRDVLLALKISVDQVLQITTDRVPMLQFNHKCNSWWLGSKGKLKVKGGQLISSTLKELQRSPDARKVLWQQVCKYEHYFFPNEI